MKSLVKTAFIVIITAFLLANNSIAQQTAKQIKQAARQAVIKKDIETKNYTFLADYALPQRGGQRYLSPGYDLRVVADSVIAYLPYFGQVYMDPPLNPDDAGIKFTSTKFNYTTEQKKKGGWSILISPSDAKQTAKLRLEVSVDGYATLMVTSNNRDMISFNGYIKQREAK